MANQRVRVVGSGYSTFAYRGKPIAFLEQVEDSGQRAFSDAGAPYQFIQPIGSRHPIEIATSRVLQGGTLQLTIRELWNAPVWQQLTGLTGTQNIVDVFDALAADPSYVTCQTTITPPNGAGRPRGKIYHNCLDGETKILTDRGTFTLAELAGQTVNVMSSRGSWTTAEVQSFGVQKLSAVTVSRQGRKKTLWATPEHRWFVQGSKPQKSGSIETTTSELRSGDRLVSTFRPSRTKNIRPSAFGIAHGITFGDGNIEGKAHNSAGVSLWGDKDAQLLKWFPHSPTRNVTAASGLTGIRVVDLPSYFKTLPSLTESHSYVYGFLAGYFAADGCVDGNGSASISSSNISSLEFVRDMFNEIGVTTFGITTESRQGLGSDISDLHKMVIRVEDLTEDFFLIENHRARASLRLGREDSAVKSVAAWTVDSVIETERYEEVFCAVVPDGQAFVLEDNLLTGNCVVVDISDNDTITVGGLAVTKGIVVAYTHSTKL